MLSRDKYSYFWDKTKVAFADRLDITWIDWEDDGRFEIKANIRNLDFQLMPKDTTWVLWLDPDCLFHPAHFEYLQKQFVKYANRRRMLSIHREEVSPELSEKVLMSETYDAPVKECIGKIGGLDKTTTFRERRAIGFYQLLSMRTIRDLKIETYSRYCDDVSILDGARKYTTKSERELYRSIGSVPLLNFPSVFHLDHVRNRARIEYLKTNSF